MGMMADKLIYTLGTGLRSSEEFAEILMAYGIRDLIDVRSFPRSKIPAFTRQNLEMLLKEHGIAYHFMGRELGGMRKGGYEAYTATVDFLRGIDLLEQTALQAPSVIICAEHFPWKCHRKWIARELQRRGWAVHHIIDKGKVWVPK